MFGGELIKKRTNLFHIRGRTRKADKGRDLPEKATPGRLGGVKVIETGGIVLCSWAPHFALTLQCLCLSEALCKR